MKKDVPLICLPKKVGIMNNTSDNKARKEESNDYFRIFIKTNQTHQMAIYYSSSFLFTSFNPVQLAPLLIQQAIDGPITDLSKGLPFDETVFLTQSAQYMGMTVLGAIGFYLSMRLLMHCANRIAENLRNQAYDVMRRLPISYFDDKPAGKIATRIVNDTETLRTQFYGTF